MRPFKSIRIDFIQLLLVFLFLTILSHHKTLAAFNDCTTLSRECCWRPANTSTAWQRHESIDDAWYRRVFRSRIQRPPPVQAYYSSILTDQNGFSSLESCSYCSRTGNIKVWIRYWTTSSAQVHLCWKQKSGLRDLSECRELDPSRGGLIDSEQLSVQRNLPIFFSIQLRQLNTTSPSLSQKNPPAALIDFLNVRSELCYLNIQKLKSTRFVLLGGSHLNRQGTTTTTLLPNMPTLHPPQSLVDAFFNEDDPTPGIELPTSATQKEPVKSTDLWTNARDMDFLVPKVLVPRGNEWTLEQEERRRLEDEKEPPHPAFAVKSPAPLSFSNMLGWPQPTQLPTIGIANDHFTNEIRPDSGLQVKKLPESSGQSEFKGGRLHGSFGRHKIYDGTNSISPPSLPPTTGDQPFLQRHGLLTNGPILSGSSKSFNLPRLNSVPNQPVLPEAFNSFGSSNLPTLPSLTNPTSPGSQIPLSEDLNPSKSTLPEPSGAFNSFSSSNLPTFPPIINPISLPRQNPLSGDLNLFNSKPDLQKMQIDQSNDLKPQEGLPANQQWAKEDLAAFKKTAYRPKPFELTTPSTSLISTLPPKLFNPFADLFGEEFADFLDPAFNTSKYDEMEMQHEQLSTNKKWNGHDHLAIQKVGKSQKVGQSSTDGGESRQLQHKMSRMEKIEKDGPESYRLQQTTSNPLKLKPPPLLAVQSRVFSASPSVNSTKNQKDGIFESKGSEKRNNPPTPKHEINKIDDQLAKRQKFAATNYSEAKFTRLSFEEAKELREKEQTKSIGNRKDTKGIDFQSDIFHMSPWSVKKQVKKCNYSGGCLFEKSTCNFTNSKTLSSNSQFRRVSVGPSNFVEARVGAGDVAVFESRVNVSSSLEGFHVLFDYLEWTEGEKLSACCHTPGRQPIELYCPFESSTNETEIRWQSEKIKCEPETQRILFICENYGHRSGICALDNVRLHAEWDTDFKEACQSELLSLL